MDFPCLLLLFVLALLIHGGHGFGSMSTLSTSYNSNGDILICGILQGSVQRIQCWNSANDSVGEVSPSSSSFLGISGGKEVVCAIREDTERPFCWDMGSIVSPRRLRNDAYSQVVVGDSHVCALSAANGSSNGSLATCWRNETIIKQLPSQQRFKFLASGDDFVCGLKDSDSTVDCWGTYDAFRLPNATFRSIQAGSRHACGLTEAWNLQCWGDNTYNQLNPPKDRQFLALALGDRHSCGIDALNRNVSCWGDDTANRTSVRQDLTFATIAAGDSFTCGILMPNFSVFCWGDRFLDGTLLPLDATVPNFCTSVNCDSYSFQQQSNISGGICGSSQHVCTPCKIGCEFPFVQTTQCGAQQDVTCTLQSPFPAPIPASSSPSPATMTPTELVRYTTKLSKGLIALTVLGGLGVLCGLLAISWCTWAKFYGPVGFSCDGSQGRVHNSTAAVLPATATEPSPKIKRQRSSTSSMRSRGELSTGRAQAFTTAEMAAATMGFSDDNRIAAGSFGVVYRGMLPDGREVAIKRGDKEAVANDRKVGEKETAFQSELEFLSRLHHKHLVSLVGYCDEEDERMLVYDFMPNRSLHDHLHGRSGGGALPWQMRIKIALEAARGVEYLHTYAMPPIIHRDIKSSNILLDGSWNARVSDFGLSTRGPGENSHLSLMAAGTLGYMDPEYYRLQHLTIKSDVYSYGVVLLELLTGERAIHKQSHGPVNIVDFALPRIINNDLLAILDQRPAPPEGYELRALEVIAHLAAKCVHLEGKERPTMTEIVGVLEEAMAYGSSGRSRSQSVTTSMSVATAAPDQSFAPVAPDSNPVIAPDTNGAPAPIP